MPNFRFRPIADSLYGKLKILLRPQFVFCFMPHCANFCDAS